MTSKPGSVVAHRREADGESLDRAGRDDLLFVADHICSYPLPVDGYAGDDDYDGLGNWNATAMARVHIYQRLVTHLDSANELTAHFYRYPEVADALGLDDVPNFRTVNRSWREQFDATTKKNLKGLVKRLRKNLLDGPKGPAAVVSRTVKTQDGRQIPQEEKEAAYAKVENSLHDLLDYDRSDNARIPAKTFTDFAAYCARNWYFPEEASETWAAEEAQGEEEVFSAESFRQAIRKKGRNWAIQNTAQTQPVSPDVDYEELDWSLDPREEYDTGKNWHSLTEEAIEKTVQTLRKEGALDDSVPIAIDGTITDYNRHGSTDSDIPPGVHKGSNLDTRYGWEDLTATAQIDGRTVVLANINYVPDDDLFAHVKYLIDRCRELVDVDCFYADSEFGNTDILRYLHHVGEDYVIKAREYSTIKEIFEEVDGDAGWRDYTMFSGSKNIEIDTTLIAIEADYHSDTKDEDEEESRQTEIGDYSPSTGQSTLDELEEEKDRDYVGFFTNKTVKSEGIKPSENPVAHDSRNTVWGLAESYRRRWSIETGFRQVKHQFSPRTASRDLGVRRFYFMMSVVLYNSWATMNLIIQQEVPEWDYERPPVKGNVFLVEIALRLRPPPH